MGHPEQSGIPFSTSLMQSVDDLPMIPKLPTHLLAFATMTVAMLLSAGIEAREISHSTRQFGDIAYSETVSSRSEGEPSFVGIADKNASLSLQVPVPIGVLAIEDVRMGMTIGLRDKRCRVSTLVDGYRDLSTREIGRRLTELRSGCNWSDAAVANSLAILDREAGNLQEAVAYMRRRAIALFGSDVRCDSEIPPPSHGGPPIIQLPLDGHPLAACGSAVSTFIETKGDPK